MGGKEGGLKLEMLITEIKFQVEASHRFESVKSFCDDENSFKYPPIKNITIFQSENSYGGCSH